MAGSDASLSSTVADIAERARLLAGAVSCRLLDRNGRCLVRRGDTELWPAELVESWPQAVCAPACDLSFLLGHRERPLLVFRQDARQLLAVFFGHGSCLLFETEGSPRDGLVELAARRAVREIEDKLDSPLSGYVMARSGKAWRERMSQEEPVGFAELRNSCEPILTRLQPFCESLCYWLLDAEGRVVLQDGRLEGLAELQTSFQQQELSDTLAALVSAATPLHNSLDQGELDHDWGFGGRLPLRLICTPLNASYLLASLYQSNSSAHMQRLYAERLRRGFEQLLPSAATLAMGRLPRAELPADGPEEEAEPVWAPLLASGCCLVELGSQQGSEALVESVGLLMGDPYVDPLRAETICPLLLQPDAFELRSVGPGVGWGALLAEELAEPFCLVLVSPDGLDFGLDARLQITLLVLLPSSAGSQIPRLAEALPSMFARGLRARLLAARDSDEAARLLRHAESHQP